MVDLENKIIFIHIPKTAGTSIERSMKEEAGEKHPMTRFIPIRDRPRPLMRGIYGEHSTLQHRKEADRLNLDDYSSFTVIRNPWDRDYSFFRFSFVDVIEVKNGASPPTFKEYILAIKSLKETGKTDEIKKLKQGWPLCSTLQLEKNGPEWLKKRRKAARLANKHAKEARERERAKACGWAQNGWWRRRNAVDPRGRGKIEPHIFGNQCDYIKLDGKVAINHIIPFENLQEEYDKFRKMRDLPRIKLPHQLKGLYRTAKNAPTTYRDAYTPELKEMVAEIRKEDIELFGYSF